MSDSWAHRWDCEASGAAGALCFFTLSPCMTAAECHQRLAAERARARADHLDPYTCPHCSTVNRNPNDIRARYCGRCHRFWDEPPPPGSDVFPAVDEAAADDY
jgi:hypothetical protein